MFQKNPLLLVALIALATISGVALGLFMAYQSLQSDDAQQPAVITWLTPELGFLGMKEGDLAVGSSDYLRKLENKLPGREVYGTSLPTMEFLRRNRTHVEYLLGRVNTARCRRVRCRNEYYHVGFTVRHDPFTGCNFHAHRKTDSCGIKILVKEK